MCLLNGQKIEMKINRKWRVLLALLPATTNLSAQTPPFDETWSNTGTGIWADYFNWTPSLPFGQPGPTGTQSVLVDNGGTAQVAAPGAMASSLTIGLTTPGSTVALLSGGTLNVAQTVVVGTAGTLSLAGGQFFANNYQNSGAITSPGSVAISFSGAGTVVNNAGGTITGSPVAIFTGMQPVSITNFGTITGSGTAIVINGGGTVTNEASGSITSTSNQAIQVTTSSGMVNISNSGTISSSFGGVGFGNAAGGTVTNNASGIIQATGINSLGISSDSMGLVTVINSGTISGVTSGIQFVFAGSVTNNAGGFIGQTGANGSGIFFGNGGSVTNNTSGIIQGTGANSIGIASAPTGNMLKIVNSGTISGLQTGVSLSGTGDSITNSSSGSITAPAPATGAFTQGIMVSGSSESIVNAGLISGENGIVFNAGGTVTNNSGGTIQGTGRNDNGFNSNTGSAIYAFTNTSPVTVVNEANATIKGVGTDSWGIHTGSTPINITNYGVISGTVNAINVNGGGTFTNEAGAVITSTTFQPISVTSGGIENIVNSGIITSSFGGIGFSNGNASGTITNNAGGAIGGTGAGSFGIATSSTNVINVINSGGIAGGGSGISLSGGGSITNNAGAEIVAPAPTTGAFTQGILISNTAAKIVNAGLISGENGIVFDTGGTVTNMKGGTIAGISRNDNGFDSITGAGIDAFQNTALVTVTNEAGATIKGFGTDSWGIHTGITPMNIINFGLISGTLSAINVNGGGTFINEAGASITSTTFQPLAVTHGTEDIINFGTISSTFGGIGFGVPAGGGSVTNNVGGVISGTGPGSFGIASGGTSQSIMVINSGVISGSSGIDLGTGGGSITNNATGSITGFSGSAVDLASGSNTTIVNSGTISSVSGNAIHFEGSASGSVTNNLGGVLSGGGGQSAILSGTGAISLSNAGTINGAVNLGNAANTVTLIAGGKINGNLNLGPNAESKLILDGTGAQTIGQAVTGTITNLGSLTKQGSGNWIIDFNQELTAPVSAAMLAGTFTVNGTLTSSQVTTAPGAILNGSGKIIGNLTNSGVLSPGNSPGTFTVNGNYTQNAAGTLRIQVASVSEYSLLAVSGHASLAGTLQLIGLGGFMLHPGDQLTFLTAKGGVSGSFGTIQDELPTSPLVKVQVETLSDSVVLEGKQGSFVQAACNPNSVAVAKSLDSALANPQASTLIAFLNNQPVNNLCGDFTLIAPGELVSVFNAGVSLANVQTANLMRRMDDVRAGSIGFSSAGFSINGGTTTYGDGFAGPAGPEGKSAPKVFAPTPGNRWGVWVTGIGEFANVDSTNGAPGYDIQTGGFTLGVDFRVCPIFAVGLTAGYSNINANLANGGSLDANAGELGIYATVFGSGFYADAAITGGPTGYDTQRTALNGSANGSTIGGNFNVVIAAGYDWKRGGLSIGPTANFQYTYVGVNGFTESGSLAPLKIDSQNVESERTAFGMKASYEWKVGHVSVIPELSLAWQHEFGDQAYSIVSSFANGAGNSFTVTGPQIGRDSMLIGAGAAVLLSERVSVYAYYDGELLRTNYQSNSVTAGVRMTF
jgi:outer membrane autotransporter protein